MTGPRITEVPGVPGPPRKLLATLAVHPHLASAFTRLGDTFFWNGVLAPEERELVIMRAAGGRSAYVAEGHEPIARRAGVSQADIEDIAQPAYGGRWTDRQAALLQACDKLMLGEALDERTHAALTEGHDPRELLELLVLVAFYRAVISIARAYELEPEVIA
jgi:4-carboxymuconolactone decarboxylase